MIGKKGITFFGETISWRAALITYVIVFSITVYLTMKLDLARLLFG